MSLPTVPPATLLTKQTWFWASADIVVGVLLLVNLLLLAAVYGRALREKLRGRREARFRARFDATLLELRSASPDKARLRRELGGLNELQRPLAARMLTDELAGASPEQRERILALLRGAGTVEAMLRSTRRRLPWRRALAIRTLGLLGAEEAVPELIARLSDRSRYVRETAVRALGRIGDERALQPLAGLFAEPGSAAPGVVYQALVSIGQPSAQIFQVGLQSQDEHVRVASVFGVASLLDPEVARPLIEPMLADQASAVRAAAAEVLGRIGGAQVSDQLMRAARDEQPSVRRAAVSALAGYGDPKSVRLALEALDDPDRDTALRAGETLVHLSRGSAVGGEAAAAIAGNDGWPVETARMTSPGAL